jgi:hypothetical protein
MNPQGPVAEYNPTKNIVEEATICCGHKRCPHVALYEDGSVIITDDDQRIEFDPAQARVLLAMLDRAGVK